MSEDPKQVAELDPAFVALVEAFSAAVDDGRMEDAGKASAAVMDFVGENAQDNPDPYFIRSVIAHRAEHDCQWDVLRRIYTEDLEAASRDASDPAGYYLKSRAYEHLAHVESCAGSDAAAYDITERAVEAAREGDSELTTAIALESYAGYALGVRQIESAIQAADEGLKLLPDDRSHGIIRTQLLTRRADAQIRLGNYQEARSSTEAAWKALEPWSSMEDAAGVQFTTARLWRIEAKLRSGEQQPWPKIRQAWEVREIPSARHRSLEGRRLGLFQVVGYDA